MKLLYDTEGYPKDGGPHIGHLLYTAYTGNCLLAEKMLHCPLPISELSQGLSGFPLPIPMSTAEWVLGCSPREALSIFEFLNSSPGVPWRYLKKTVELNLGL